ncbi:hypothetical protein JOM56_010095 [Amanita muscaria]
MTLCGCCDSASNVDQAEEEGWKKVELQRSFNAGGARLDMPFEARICSFAPPDCIFAIFVSRMAHQFLEDVIQVVPHYSFENEDLLPSNARCEPPGSLGGKEYCGNTGPMLLSSI